MDLSSILKCRICYRKFDLSSITAYQLNCQHNFCGKCLRKMVQDTRSSMNLYSMSVDDYIRDHGKHFITCALCTQETYFNHISEIKKCLLITQLLDLEKAQSKSGSFQSKSRTSSALSCASRMSANDLMFDEIANEKRYSDEFTADDECSNYSDLKASSSSSCSETRNRTDSINDISFVFEKYANKEIYFRKLFESLDSDKDAFVKVADIKRLLAKDFQYEKYSENDDHSTIHNEMELLKDSDLVDFDTFVRIFMYILKSELKLKSQDMLELLTKKSADMDGFRRFTKDKYPRMSRRRSFSSAFSSTARKENLPDVVEL